MPKVINSTEKFRVVAVSDNTNSFGLKQVVLVAKSGTAFKACKYGPDCPKKGEDVVIPVTVHAFYESHNFAAAGYEIPEQLTDVSKELVNEIYGS